MIADELLRWLSADKLCCRLIKVAGCSTAPGNNFLLIFCSDYWHSLAGLQMQTLSIRLPCLRILWNLSTCFPNLKIILQSGPSVFKFNLKRTVIFCKKNFSHLQPPQAGRAGTTSQFLNSILQIRLQKHLLDFAQTRYSAQNCAGYTFPLIPNKQIFLDKNLFYENRRWFIQYCIKPELSLPVLKVKSGTNRS